MMQRVGLTKLLLCALCHAPCAMGAPILDVSSRGDFGDVTAEHSGTAIQRSQPVGGRFDLLGDGALLLEKQEAERSFWETGRFQREGVWTSSWVSSNGQVPEQIAASVWVYGRRQDMRAGWNKFAGGPLVTHQGWRHASEYTLELPVKAHGNPNDQALVRGAGPWQGKWLLLFNVGSWAKDGWAAAAADSLAPTRAGHNPFEIAEPYPLVSGEGRGGKHAPNDFIYVPEYGKWLAPDESGDGKSRMWSSPDLKDWTNHGEIKGMHGHDPGIAWDGKRFHLFNEDGDVIAHCEATDPLGKWRYTGTVLEVGHHTGDADVSFFNNRWHMFFDDWPHGNYKLGHAWTTPGEFPRGWRIRHHVYGPHKPNEAEVWDDPTDAGNAFGTGDADIAVQGDTLYLTHERPVGLAYKELAVRSLQQQRVAIRLQADQDGDGRLDDTTSWLRLDGGKQHVAIPSTFRNRQTAALRVQIRLSSALPSESPMVRSLRVQ